jgi:hypothetical protein
MCSVSISEFEIEGLKVEVEGQVLGSISSTVSTVESSALKPGIDTCIEYMHKHLDEYQYRLLYRVINT